MPQRCWAPTAGPAGSQSPAQRRNPTAAAGGGSEVLWQKVHAATTDCLGGLGWFATRRWGTQGIRAGAMGRSWLAGGSGGGARTARAAQTHTADAEGEDEGEDDADPGVLDHHLADGAKDTLKDLGHGGGCVAVAGNFPQAVGAGPTRLQCRLQGLAGATVNETEDARVSKQGCFPCHPNRPSHVIVQRPRSSLALPTDGHTLSREATSGVSAPVLWVLSERRPRPPMCGGENPLVLEKTWQWVHESARLGRVQTALQSQRS